MAPAPGPPILPESFEAFTAHASGDLGAWYTYFQQAHGYIMSAEEAASAYRSQLVAATDEIAALREGTACLRATQQLLEKQHTSLFLELAQARAENLNLANASATAIATPASTSTVSPTLPDDLPADSDLPAPTLNLPVPTLNLPAASARPALSVTPARPASTLDQRTHLSERLPDPSKFEGDRKDLRRFVSQIKEKLTVNYDRFPTPQARMAYVNGRLGPGPYAQILPHIVDGSCQLEDYNEILERLGRAYGDPNRVHNARKELFRLRQTNKDFATFFAEFARLALEGEMNEDALPPLLEEAVSREIRGMMMHHDPPARTYHAFAGYLQDLENRLLAHQPAPSETRPRAHPPASSAWKSGPAPPVKPDTRNSSRPNVPTLPAPATNPVLALPAPRTRDPDAMDLSNQRHTLTRPATARPGINRAERRECFRCGSSTHFVRDCPRPDTRNLLTVSASREASVRSGSPDSDRGNGVSLG